MNFIQKHPILFAIVIILIILTVALAIFYFVYASRSSTPPPSNAGILTQINQQQTTSTPVIAPVVVKKPADLTDDELIAIWKSLGCKSGPGTTINNASSKAFWRKFDTIDNMKKDMATWFAMRNKSKSNALGCYGNFTTGCDYDTKAPNYQYCKFKDSDQGDLVIRKDLANNVAGLVSACNTVTNCKGFNTNGVLKANLVEPSKWVSWTTDPNKGMYVKQQTTENFTNPRGFDYDSPFY